MRLNCFHHLIRIVSSSFITKHDVIEVSVFCNMFEQGQKLGCGESNVSWKSSLFLFLGLITSVSFSNISSMLLSSKSYLSW